VVLILIVVTKYIILIIIIIITIALLLLIIVNSIDSENKYINISDSMNNRVVTNNNIVNKVNW